MKIRIGHAQEGRWDVTITGEGAADTPEVLSVRVTRAVIELEFTAAAAGPADSADDPREVRFRFGEGEPPSDQQVAGGEQGP